MRKWGLEYVSLPPLVLRERTPEERAEQATLMAEYLADVERRAKETERQRQWRAAHPITEAERERRQSKALCRTLRRTLPEAAEAQTFARAATLLDDKLGLIAWPARDTADKLCARAGQRTRKVYSRAAAGCEVCAEFLADEVMDDFYQEAFAE